ncbi:glycosyltransferase family 2 protein [Amycolatopsis regifaucium]|uniref:Glycosyl transferase n=1 Tax=Amycolatopsis regifaucium TaxID=546365 RepID=A0A154M4N6_9PSEU|nr:glycosyltransferase [Amycolatopsis regifaucium]KZB79327.1 glycosyl transferase [Amycolatopsis regifaucium]OKA07510.1 glycosyl transferase [Amycolatopsis regifaucium]SFH09676.1 Glycosyltransferase, GT2 family [Amycolatopsis regifaucium]
MTGARTTVVIATRNRATELTRTLTELTALRPRPPVIVLDNASSDDTADRAAGVPGVRVVRLPRNLGAAARNLGVALARTPYVAFSDDDSWWAEDALAEAERILEAHADVGLVAAKTLVGEEEREDPVVSLMAESPLGTPDGLPGPSVLGFLACSAVVRRKAYLQAAGFSPLLHFGAEERLLSYDLAAHGWRLCYVDRVRAHHHPSSVRPSRGWRERTELRNRLLITVMRRPVRQCLADGLRVLTRIPREPRVLGALAGALRRLPSALAERRPLPVGVERQIRVLEHAQGG